MDAKEEINKMNWDKSILPSVFELDKDEFVTFFTAMASKLPFDEKLLMRNVFLAYKNEELVNKEIPHVERARENVNYMLTLLERYKKTNEAIKKAGSNPIKINEEVPDEDFEASLDKLTRSVKKLSEDLKKKALLDETIKARYPKPPYRVFAYTIFRSVVEVAQDGADRQEIERLLISCLAGFRRMYPESNPKKLGKAFRKYPILWVYFPKDWME